MEYLSLRFTLVLGVCFLACRPATAQAVRPVVRVTNDTTGCLPTTGNLERVLAVSRVDGNRVVVAWQCDHPFYGQQVFYAISDDGARTFTCPLSVSFANDPQQCAVHLVGDPMITAMASGDIYVGALVRTGALDVDAIGMARIPSGSSQSLAGISIVPCGIGADKCMAAAGPWPPHLPAGVVVNTPEMLFVGWNQNASRMYTVHSTDALPTGSSWTYSAGAFGYPQELDHANRPVNPFGANMQVMRGGLNPGRVVLGYGRWDRPRMVYSDTAGEAVENQTRWHLAHAMNEYLDTTDPSAPEFRELATSVLDQFIQVPFHSTPGAGGLEDPDLHVRSEPSLAVSPANLNEIVAASVFRTEAQPSNMDVFVSQSLNQGQTWQTYRITDAMLTLPGDCPGGGVCEQDQFNVWGAIDQFGGYNLLFCRTADPDDAPGANVTCTVRYARWPNFQSIINRQMPFSRTSHVPSSRCLSAAMNTT